MSEPHPADSAAGAPGIGTESGDPLVDEALRDLGGLDQLSAAERLDRLTRAHQRVQDALDRQGDDEA